MVLRSFVTLIREIYFGNSVFFYFRYIFGQYNYYDLLLKEIYYYLKLYNLLFIKIKMIVNIFLGRLGDCIIIILLYVDDYNNKIRKEI